METIIFVLEILGVITFSISGAIIAIKKSTDLFGVIFLTIVSAAGGGMVRDVIIGKIPPSIFENYIFALISSICAVGVFVLISMKKQFFFSLQDHIDNVINVFDALGLGVFTVNGMNVVLASSIEADAFLTIFVGLCTGVGGGILRDVFVNDVPFVLRKRVYAVASLSGGTVYFILYHISALSDVISVTVGILIVFTIRMCATKFKWDLPKIVLPE